MSTDVIFCNFLRNFQLFIIFIVIYTEHLHHPISLDLFENQLYWLSRETGELVKQDKFGRGVPVTIAKDLVNPTGVKGWLLLEIVIFFFKSIYL